MLRRLIALGLLAASLGTHAVDESTLREAKSLIDAGRPGQAYALLKPLEEAEAGNPDFDYLLGLAALDAGHRTEAIFALQRAVDVNPDHGPARAELGRAYMLVNETDEARRELEQVRAQNPPDDVQAVLDRYLAAIDQYHGAYRTTFSRNVRTGLGFDTNINFATDQGQVAAPGLGGLVFNLTSDSQEIDSSVWNVGAGFTFSSPLRTDLRLVGGIDFDYRITFQDDDFTTALARGHTGLQYTRGQDEFSLLVEGQRFFVDGSGATSSDRQLGGTIVQWRRALTRRTQVSAFGQAALIRYPEQQVRNVNRYLGGLGLGHAFEGARGSPVVFVSAYGGTENSQNDRTGLGGGKHFDNDFFGVRAGGRYQLDARSSLFLDLSYQHSDYDAPDPLFASRRDDDFFNLRAGYRFRYDGNWSVTPHLTWTNNDSNIVVNDYDRVAVMITVRNDF